MSKEKPLHKFGKFWILWSSCIEKSRTVQEVQKAWNYSSNALYEEAGKGHDKPIWKEMIEEGYLEKEGEIQKRGTRGILLSAKFDWLEDYFKTKYNNVGTLAQLWKNPKTLIQLIKTDWVRKEVLELENIKKLFSDRKFFHKSPNAFFSALYWAFLEQSDSFSKITGVINMEAILNMILDNIGSEVNYKEFKKEVKDPIRNHKDSKEFKEFIEEAKDKIDVFSVFSQ